MTTGRTDLYPSKAVGNYISADTYKSNCATDFGIKQNANWGAGNTRAGGMVSTKVQNYNHVALTIDAIEAGRKESWFSGFSNAATDVAKASIELLEDCRERLVKLEETIKNDESLNAAEKAKKLKDERAKILDTLKLIRNANNPKMYNLKWLSDFYAEGKKFINSKNVGILTVCIAVPVIAALFIPSPLTPIVFAGLAVFMFARFVSGLWKAASAANQKSMEESGQKVKEMADLMIERDAKQFELPRLQAELADAQKRVKAIDVKQAEVEAARTSAPAAHTANNTLLASKPKKTLEQHITEIDAEIKKLHAEFDPMKTTGRTATNGVRYDQLEKKIPLLEKQLELLELEKALHDLKPGERAQQQAIIDSIKPRVDTLVARQASAQARQKSTGPNQTESIEDLYERTRAGRGKF